MVQFIKPLIDQLTQYCCCLIPDKCMFIIVLKCNYPTNKKNREGWHPAVGLFDPKALLCHLHNCLFLSNNLELEQF